MLAAAKLWDARFSAGGGAATRKDELLDNLRVEFDPLRSLGDGRVVGVESLLRIQGGDGRFPADRYAEALRRNRLVELETAALALAVREAGRLHPEVPLFVNLHPRSLERIDPLLTTFSHQTGKASLEHMVFEISEEAFSQYAEAFVKAVKRLREAGAKIALDDVGAGQAGLYCINRIRPEYIKLDHALTRDVDVNPFKRSLVECLILVAGKFRSLVTAEGVETDVELGSLKSMGVTIGQGRELDALIFSQKPALFAKPSGFCPPDGPGVSGVACICEIVHEAFVVESRTIIKQVKDTLAKSSPMSSCVVMDRGRPVGLVMNYNLDRRLGSRFGASLYYDREVNRVMDPNPLIVDVTVPIGDVANRAMSREQDKLYDDVIVMKDGGLLGVASVQRMLDALAKAQVEMAKGANPLTGLPGNTAIERELAERTKRREPSSPAYVDLDNFKVYNDVYGFSAGDKVILLMARALKRGIEAHGGGDVFLGHVGGDDFVLFAPPDRVEPICREALAHFAAEIPKLYTPADVKRGYIEAVGRDGVMGRFGLVSASIGAFDLAYEVPFSLDDLSQRAVEIKKFAKREAGNSFVRDRRAPLGAATG